MKLNCFTSLLVSCLILSLTACGFHEEHIRDYVFYAHVDDPDNQLYINTIDTLVDDFNSCLGFTLFKTTRDTSLYNSSIYFDANLSEMSTNGDVVGYGTYIRKTTEDSPLNLLKGSSPSVYYTYTGEIRLDSDFFAKNTVSIDGLDVDKNTDEYQELKKLFFHESGHVIGLDHTDSKEDVMYYEISGEKNFQDFCNTINKYLNEND